MECHGVELSPHWAQAARAHIPARYVVILYLWLRKLNAPKNRTTEHPFPTPAPFTAVNLCCWIAW